jgi:hypothetical protein
VCDLFGFLVYIIILFGLFISVYMFFMKKNYLLLLFSMFYSVFIASFRGLSGVDTHMYILRYEFLKPFNIDLIEPVIPFLMSIVKFFNGGFIGFSLLYGFIISVLYFYIFKKYNNAIYFGLIMFPVIYIDSLFNGIRIGLAYPLIILAIVNSSLIFFILAVLTHVSSLLIGVFKILQNKYISITIILLVILIILLSDVSIFNLLPIRYQHKYMVYKQLHVKNIYSGLADSFILYITLVIYLRLNGLKGKVFFIKSLMLSVLIILYHVILVYNFAFMLRVTRLLEISILALIAKKKNKIDKLALYISFIIGIVYILNFIRQINSTCDYEIGGFLPLDLNYKE